LFDAEASASEIGHWILFVICLLRFVISSLAKKRQDFTIQVPKGISAGSK